jgi:hypothetical protein
VKILNFTNEENKKMLGDQSSLFESVKRLHAYELYEDLLLFADLNLSDQQYRMEKMGEDAVAYVHFCIADAHFQLGNFPQCIRVYILNSQLPLQPTKVNDFTKNEGRNEIKSTLKPKTQEMVQKYDQ